MTSPEGRFQSFEEFWPYYLSEHRNATSRRLHFAGTSSFFASCVASTVTSPVKFPLAMAGFAALLAHGATQEPKGRPLAHILGMVALPTLASPMIFPAGVVSAYACAWVGHFQIEGNRPATFEYPLWSFLADLRMWSHMARGRLWSGDPLEELGLEARAKPAAKEEDVATDGPVAAMN
jgi:hypothetical protein